MSLLCKQDLLDCFSDNDCFVESIQNDNEEANKLEQKINLFIRILEQKNLKYVDILLSLLTPFLGDLVWAHLLDFKGLGGIALLHEDLDFSEFGYRGR